MARRRRSTREIVVAVAIALALLVGRGRVAWMAGPPTPAAPLPTAALRPAAPAAAAPPPTAPAGVPRVTFDWPPPAGSGQAATVAPQGCSTFGAVDPYAPLPVATELFASDPESLARVRAVWDARGEAPLGEALDALPDLDPAASPQAAFLAVVRASALARLGRADPATAAAIRARAWDAWQDDPVLGRFLVPQLVSDRVGSGALDDLVRTAPAGLRPDLAEAYFCGPGPRLPAGSTLDLLGPAIPEDQPHLGLVLAALRHQLRQDDLAAEALGRVAAGLAEELAGPACVDDPEPADPGGAAPVPASTMCAGISAEVRRLAAALPARAGPAAVPTWEIEVERALPACAPDCSCATLARYEDGGWSSVRPSCPASTVSCLDAALRPIVPPGPVLAGWRFRGHQPCAAP